MHEKDEGGKDGGNHRVERDEEEQREGRDDG